MPWSCIPEEEDYIRYPEINESLVYITQNTTDDGIKRVYRAFKVVVMEQMRLAGHRGDGMVNEEAVKDQQSKWYQVR